jgi:N-acetyl-gamma-glutamyl-phosphate reductase
MKGTMPAVVLGATGYVGGELLRLLALHPHLRLAAAVSRSSAGEPIASVFSHLASAYPETRFQEPGAVDSLIHAGGPTAVFSALPHGESGTQIEAVLSDAVLHNADLRVVDLSADLRLESPDLAVPGHSFLCALPELVDGAPTNCISHPGCFTTAVTLAARPLLALGLAHPRLQVSAVTGSTGSGREPKPATHHPVRHGNLRAYEPLRHRHEPEMRMLLGRDLPVEPEILFVPHSGPFARGIHATVFAQLREPATKETLRDAFRAFYAGSPFVHVVDTPPDLKDVVGTNQCRLFVEARDDNVVVLSVLDNLVKGAAGGAVQWMNRLCGFDETTGLMQPALGWT